MRVRVNGEWREFPGEISIETLLVQLHLDSALVAAEVNLAVVPRAERAGRVLRDGDQVELVSFVGGG